METEAVDAVILDLLLGEDDGFEVLSWIRERRPEMPISVLSATRTASAHIRRAYELGASSYFVKGNIPLAHLYSDLAARMLDAACEQAGRDPALVRRSVQLVWDGANRGQLLDLVGQHYERGFTEQVIYVPGPDQARVARAAAEALPELRSALVR